MVRAAPGGQLRRRVELLAADAVQALVVPAVQVAAGRAGPPQAFHARPVPRVAAGADDVVDRQAQRPGQAGERGGVRVDELLDANPGGKRGEHVLERVVIGTGLEPDPLATAPAVAGEHVGLHELKRVAQVRARVDVRDRGGDIAACHRNLQGEAGAPTFPHRGNESRPREQGLVANIRAASAAPRAGHHRAERVHTAMVRPRAVDAETICPGRVLGGPRDDHGDRAPSGQLPDQKEGQ